MNGIRPGNVDAKIKSKVVFMVVMLLLVSLFLPIFSNSLEASSFSDEQMVEESEECLGNNSKNPVSVKKEVKPSNIWHSEVEDPSTDPFGTEKASVTLNLTGEGGSEEASSFEWICSLDSSGSMSKNDPDDKRIDGAQHFIDLVEQNYSGREATPRGANIDFDDSGTLINDRHLTSNYAALRQDVENVDSNGGTNFIEPLQIALDEFGQNGDPDQPDFHLFLSDGQPSEDWMDWSLVDEHADRGIPIFTIGFGNAHRQLMTEIAQRTGGEFFNCNSGELENVFEDIFEEILDRVGHLTAVESPPERPMVREVLPSYLEYVEGSASPQKNFNVYEENGNTVLEWDKEKLAVNETWQIKFDIRARRYSHDLPITAYDDNGESLSNISYKNVSSGEVEKIPIEGPPIGVHGHPEPVIGASKWEGVKVGEEVTFKNMTWDGEEKSSWPGDCEIEKYE